MKAILNMDILHNCYKDIILIKKMHHYVNVVKHK